MSNISLPKSISQFYRNDIPFLLTFFTIIFFDIYDNLFRTSSELILKKWDFKMNRWSIKYSKSMSYRDCKIPILNSITHLYLLHLTITIYISFQPDIDLQKALLHYLSRAFLDSLRFRFAINEHILPKMTLSMIFYYDSCWILSP